MAASLKCLAISKLLIKAGANVNARDKVSATLVPVSDTQLYSEIYKPMVTS